MTDSPPVYELTEYGSKEIPMSAETARQLIRVAQGRVSVSPGFVQGDFHVKAQQYVGTIVLPELHLLIRPKVTMENLLHVLGIGLPATAWLPDHFPYAIIRDLLAAFSEYYTRATRAAVAKGLLRSYREESERVPALRGRLDFPVLLSQPAREYPLPCVFDEYTADILENRVLRSAMRRLLRLSGVPPPTRASLLQLLGRFVEVADEPVNLDLVDRIVFTRLNAHYEVSVKLATLILRGATLTDLPGRAAASAFLIDMNDVFQKFLTAKLTDSLRGRLAVLPEPRHNLAVKGQVQMFPDLVFQSGGRVVYVGDAKYKLTTTGRALSPDYYQLLAYTTALNLDEGVLIYCQADGPVPPRMIEVRHAGKRLWTGAVSLSGKQKEIDASVLELGAWILGRLASALGRAA